MGAAREITDPPHYGKLNVDVPSHMAEGRVSLFYSVSLLRLF